MGVWEWTAIVASVILGQFAFLGIEIARSQIERRQRRNDQRETFQRETLLQLQETLYQLRLKTSEIIETPIDHAGEQRKSVVIGAHTDKAFDEYVNARARVWMLAARADDAQIREIIRELRDVSSRAIGRDRPHQMSGAKYDRSLELFDRAVDRIGELLRGEAKPDRH